MKYTNLVLFLALILSACGSVGPRQSQGSNIFSENENGEYEITIIDSGYDRWYSMNARPANFYSLSYYEQKNRYYVRAWNEKVGQQGFYNSVNYPFEAQIDYDPTIHYGVELNYKLFTYFQYIEDVYGSRYNFPI